MTTNKKYQPKTREELKKLCDDLSIHLGDIDTSLITDMSALFLCSDRDFEDFAGIEDWDISNVKNMNQMFTYSCFIGSIEKWAEKASALETAYQFFGCEMPHITEELKRLFKIHRLNNYFHFYFDEDVCNYYISPKKVNRSFRLSELLLIKGEYTEAFKDSVGSAILLMSKEECSLTFS